MTKKAEFEYMAGAGPSVSQEGVTRHDAIQDEFILRKALEASGQRFTEQRAAVFGFLSRVMTHPTAEEVFLAVRENVPGISLATVYKSLETLVGCGLANKLTYGDGSARYDGRTDPHHHVRCLACGAVMDVDGGLTDEAVDTLADDAGDFQVTGYRLELVGICSQCSAGGDSPQRGMS